jgi:hypothetical protein
MKSRRLMQPSPKPQDHAKRSLKATTPARGLYRHRSAVTDLDNDRFESDSDMAEFATS